MATHDGAKALVMHDSEALLPPHLKNVQATSATKSYHRWTQQADAGGDPSSQVAMGESAIKCPLPSARAQSQLLPYITLSTCRWRWALHDSAAYGDRRC